MSSGRANILGIIGVSGWMNVSLIIFQILCRKCQSGTSGSFWWVRRGKWSASGERTSPWRAFDKRPRRWCETSSWRNGWSYDGARRRIPGPHLCAAFGVSCAVTAKQWLDSGLFQLSVVGWRLAPLVVATKAMKSFKASQNVFVRAFVCVYGDHPVVDNDNHDEHSW